MGGKGREARNITGDLSGAEVAQQLGATSQTDPRVRGLLSQYGAGTMSLQDALKSASQLQKPTSARQAALADKLNYYSNPRFADPNETVEDPETGEDVPVGELRNRLKQAVEGESQGVDYSSMLGDQIAIDPMTGSKLASEQVRTDPLSKDFFGEGGLQSRLMGEEKDLAGRGFSLQPEDYEAYGQASGDIARLFGQEEQGIAQSLADRGLAAAPSGVAGAEYSKAFGNRNERLASAQRKVADDRMRMNLDRLNSARSTLMQTGQMGQQALQNQFGRNLSGVQQKQGQVSEAARMAQQGRGIQQAQMNQGFEQREATKGPSFGDILGGVGTSLLGAASGGVGTALGGGLSGILGGKGFQAGVNTSMTSGKKEK